MHGEGGPAPAAPPPPAPALHEHEAERLAALARYGVLDTPREEGFDDIAELASEICGTPVAVVSLVGEGRQWFKAELGLGVREMPLEASFCGHAVLEQDFLLVPDATEDARFSRNALVTGPAGLRFYAGVPLRTAEGLPIGALCVLDRKPRSLTDRQVSALKRLGRQVVAQLEQRRIEAALRESEARFRHMADSAPALIWMTDAEGQVTFANMHYDHLFGRPAAAMLGGGWRDIVLPEDVDAFQAAFLAAFEARRPFRAEVRVRGKDGEVRWLRCEGVPRLDDAQRFLGYTGCNLDITDAKAADAALREGEERFRNMADHAPVMMWVTDPDGSCTYLNRRWYEFTGQTEARAVGFGWLDATHPDDKAGAAEVFLKANAGREPFRFEYRLRRADGVYRWALDAAAPRFGPDGGFLGYVGSVIDIDERREIEERLRESEARFRALADAVPAFVWFASPDGDVRYLNDRWYEYTGQTPWEAVSAGWAAVLHPEDAERTTAAWADACATGATYEVEVRYRRRDGAYRWYVARAEPLRGAGGAVAAWFGTSTDIHDRKLAEAELQRLNETLEQRVAEEVGERAKAEAALRQAQKMEAIGQLTGGVAHDFNNLLTIIRSSTDLLRRPGLPEERRRRYVDAISDTVDRAAKLTGQLLAFARRQALKPEVFDAAGRVRAIADMLRTVVGGRIRIVARLADEPCLVEADASQFETALVNMAVNARDAMDGEGTLTVRVAAIAGMPAIRGHAGGPGAFVAVSLADTGSGIPADKVPLVFEPFFTTKDVGKGTGLGLSQVYGFAKQSGGDVAVESEVGRGTTFTLYLPRAERGAADEDGGDGGGACVEADGSGPAEGGSGRRVLVVEDNVEVGRSSTQVLQDLGYETTWATNAEEALARLGEGLPVDAVFTDVVMPGMSGVDLGREIRRRHPGLPVVLTSGYSHVLAEEGIHGFELLHKPYAAEELSRVLSRVTRSRGGAR